MRDAKQVNYWPYNKNTDWVTKGFYTAVFPILSQPAKSRDDIFGAAFFMKFQGLSYVVTAKHIVDIDNPVLLLTGTNRADIFFETQYFNQKGIDWVFHKNEDVAVLPLRIPGGFKRIINTSILQKQTRIPILKGQTVKHLGYPNKMTGTWSDNKKPNNISSGALGKIIGAFSNKIIVDTPARFGDSGGPLFLKMSLGPRLLGVVTETLVLKNQINPEDSVYLHKTTALPISLVYEVINSKKMKSQVPDFSE